MYQLPDAPGHYSYRPKEDQWAAEPMMLFLIELSCGWATGADMVEISPSVNTGGVTALNGAAVMYEILYLMAGRG